MIRSVGHRLRKLELRTAVAEAESLLIIVERIGPTDPPVDEDIAALKEAGFLRGSPMRVLEVLDTGGIEGLTDREQQFLAERRRTR
jgi:hypothetical protein